MDFATVVENLPIVVHKTPHEQIDTILRYLLDCGERSFIIYPFGEMGMLTKKILNEKYGVMERALIDNTACKYNNAIFGKEYLQKANDLDHSVILIVSMEHADSIYEDIKDIDAKVISIFDKRRSERWSRFLVRESERGDTPVGRGTTSGAGILASPLLESCGAYCSFAGGTKIVANHPINFVTTSPILMDGFGGRKNENDMIYAVGIYDRKFRADDFNKKVIIGHDVWLGEDVKIQNGVRIGNGVIAGSGAVITKDVPDYAIVGGVPARIIRFRFSEDQIEKLNKIAWWDWPVEKIKENYEDFFDIDLFIKKHYREY